MKHPKGQLCVRVAKCLILLLGIALLAIPIECQTFAYVTDQSSDSVSVIDTKNSKVTATVGVGHAPFGVAITPNGSRAYVTNQGSNSVSVIASEKNT